MPTSKKMVFLSSARAVWGGENSLLALASEIQRQNLADISLVSASEGLAELWRSEVNENVRVVRGGGRLRSMATFFWAALRLPSNSHAVAFDLIVVPPLALLRGVLRRRGVRLVIDVHDCPRPEQRMFVSIRLAAARFDAAIAVSRFAASQLERALPTEVVYRPVAVSERLPGFRFDQFRTIGVVGRIDPEKRVEFAIEVMRSAPADLQLVIRGSSSYAADGYAEKIVASAADLGSRVSFEGKVPKELVFDGLDALLFVSDREPSGRTLAEAQASGLPVVVVDAGGAAEFVQHGISGLKFEQNSSSSALTSLLALRESSELRETLSRGGFARARDEYDPATQARRYVDALERNEVGTNAAAGPRGVAGA